MIDLSKTPPIAPRRVPNSRRVALLGSAAGLSMAILVAGPAGYLPLSHSGWIQSAHASETKIAG